MGGVLRAALDCKLADNPAQGKKIKATNQGRMRPSASAPASFHNPQPYQLSLPAATAWQERFVKNRPIANHGRIGGLRGVRGEASFSHIVDDQMARINGSGGHAHHARQSTCTDHRFSSIVAGIAAVLLMYDFCIANNACMLPQLRARSEGFHHH